MESNIFPDKTPKITLKLKASDGEALAEWLERAQAFRKRIINGNGALRELEKKRTELEEQIAKLEARADEASAAEKLPALQIQLAGVERKFEEQSAVGHIDAIRVLLYDLTPLMRKATEPLICKEVERLTEPLRTYFRSAHRVQEAIRKSDWIVHLQKTLLTDWRQYGKLEPAIHAVERVLNNELPWPYDQTPSETDQYLDAHSDYLCTSGRRSF